MFLLSLLIAGYLGFALIHLGHDKLLHFVTFFILTVEFYFVFDIRYKSIKILRYITFVICTLCGSVGLEIIQSLVNPKRVFDIYDISSNFVGSLLGLLFSTAFQALRVRRAKNKRLQYKKTKPVAFDDQESNAADDHETEEYVNIQMQDVLEDDN